MIASARRALIRHWLTGTISGRAMAFGIVVKLAAALARMLAGNTAAVSLVDTAGDLALCVSAVVLAWRLFTDLRRVVLWRVRRKLTLSYIFIGFIPALLIIVFFLISGVLLLNNVSAFVIHNRVSAIQREARSLAQLAATEVRRARTDEDAMSMMQRLQQTAAVTYPGVSYALRPAGRTCSAAVERSRERAGVGPIAGSITAPPDVPPWVPCDGFTGVLMYLDGPPTAHAAGHLAVRSLAWPDERADRAVLVTLPLAGPVAAQMAEETGVQLGDVSVVISTPETESGGPDIDIKVSARPPSNGVTTPRAEIDRAIDWVAFFDAVDWESGRTSSVSAAIHSTVRTLWRRIAPVERVGNINFGQILLVLLAVVGALFLVIQIAAFIMGLALARSITGSVHELFAGTERVRQGDFTRKIPIRSRDQLGELAESFNSMTSSIEDLLQQKAEKERLEQELRIARAIQMSLLPQAALAVPGLSLTAHCEPAREVGGDYYDYLPLGHDRIALLIADVAGKGTSAALYMAELKGIVLSLAERHASPRDLLIDVNRILARHLDTRSFITMIYAVIDTQARTLTYVRAGHCPAIYLPGSYAAVRTAQMLLPDGMVLGLNLDNGEMFDGQLEEVTLPLGPGDLFLLYTDGISEAMNAAGECFGDNRLVALVEQHGHLPSEELRERILRDIGSFAGSTAQQDDMTMLILRTEEIGAAWSPS